jgi:formylglycine-generating enzyme required for sulfatase activity
MKKLFFLCSLFCLGCQNITIDNPLDPERQKLNKMLEFVKVEGGTFTMGDNLLGKKWGEDYYIEHEVELSDFYIQKTEVTQKLWEYIMGNNPSENKSSDDLPVTNVSWEDCQLFIDSLNKKTGKKYRLPTEAEWEYAARGGKKRKGYKFAGSDKLDEVGWYAGEYKDDGSGKDKWIEGNSEKTVHPVAQKKSNELGISDMSGNVWEWCQDWYGPYNNKVEKIKNPQGPNSGNFRVIRGGSWGNYAEYCLVARRNDWYPDGRIINGGFRLLSPVE